MTQTKAKQPANTTTMEKLKIYGVKDNSGDYDELTKKQELIATVFVDENKKVAVEAKDPRVREDLLATIYWRGKNEVPVFEIRGGAPTERLRKIEEEERKRKIFKVWATYVRPGDPDFLTGLFFGVKERKRKEGWTKFGDYYVWGHDIVEE